LIKRGEESIKPVPKLTSEMLTHARIIASGWGIRDINRLLRQYGGQTKKWKKKSTLPFPHEGKMVEVHWYEHRGIGRVDEKAKVIKSHDR
jgi:hypothetical protein